MPRKKMVTPQKTNKNEVQPTPITREQALKVVEGVNKELEDCIGAFILLDVALEGDLTDAAGKNLPQVLVTVGDVIRNTRERVQRALNLTYTML
jgi:hypothetical protein